MKKKECVYFIKQKGLTPIKIGYSSKKTPYKRIRSFETAAPFGIDLLGFISVDDGLKEEQKLHELFKLKRINNEWFDISEEIVDVLLFCYGKEKPLISNSDYFEFFRSNIVFNKKTYNIDLLNKFNKVVSGRVLINQLTNYCIINNIEITKGKDSRRWFILKQL